MGMIAKLEWTQLFKCFFSLHSFVKINFNNIQYLIT